MQVLIAGSKKVALSRNEEWVLWIKLGLIYLLTWIPTYLELPLPVRVVVFIGMLAYSLQSYFNATVIAFLVIYIHFYAKFFPGVPGLDPFRVLIIPYVIMSLRRPVIRKFPMHPHLLFILLFSIASLKITADILEIIQDVPLSMGQTSKKSTLNLLAGYYEIFAVLSFFYFAFTRHTIYELKKWFNVVLLFTVFQAITLLFIVYKNPEVVLERETLHGAGEFDKFVLWQNPHFGHKNDWGLLLAFTVIIIVVKLMIKRVRNSIPSNKVLIIFMIFCLITIAISLSRQAYVWTVIGTGMIAIGTKSIKYFIGLTVGLMIVAITQPKFIMDRIDSMVNVRNAEDFQKLNRKVSTQAWEQAVNNWQWHPRMFYSEWEYNWSEGFWNGMLHQQGIMGFMFHIYIYIFMFLHYFALYKHKNEKLSMYGLLGTVLVFLMFFACFNRRSTHFLHYKGFFTQVNILLMFVFTYIELVRYAVKRRLSDLKYL